MSNTLSSDIHIRIAPEIKASVKSFELSSMQLTENGYTVDFEAELLSEAEDCYAAVANGTAKLYKNAAELFADLDAEDDMILYLSGTGTHTALFD